MKFRSKKTALIAAACIMGAAAIAPALAHHSFAMFDQTRLSKTTNATVTQFRFTNPHSFVVVNYNVGGKMTRYVFECSSVNMMTKGGWKHNSLKAGDKVTVTYYPLRNGKPGGMLKTIKLPNGRTVSGW